MYVSTLQSFFLSKIKQRRACKNPRKKREHKEHFIDSAFDYFRNFRNEAECKFNQKHVFLFCFLHDRYGNKKFLDSLVNNNINGMLLRSLYLSFRFSTNYMHHFTIEAAERLREVYDKTHKSHRVRRAEARRRKRLRCSRADRSRHYENGHPQKGTYIWLGLG